MKLARQSRLILYRLKRDNGMPIIVRRTLSRTTNRSTGVVTSNHKDQPIKLAILLPLGKKIAFEHDQAYTGAGRNFTYGALYDPNQRQIIIEARDLPFELTKSDQIIAKGKVAEILSIQEYEPLASYLIITKYIENNQ